MAPARILTAYLGNAVDELLVLDDLPADGTITAHLAVTSAPGAPALHPMLRLDAAREGAGVRVTLSAHDLQRGVQLAKLLPSLYYLHVQVRGQYHVACRIRLRAVRVR